MAAALAVTSHANLARPRLDGGEHDVILGQRRDPSQTDRFNGCYKNALRLLPDVIKNKNSLR